MNLGKYLYAIVIAGIVGFVALALFPSIHTVLGNTNTTGFSYLLTAMVAFLPYALIGIVLYLILKASRGGT